MSEEEQSLSMTSENTAPVSERGEHQWLIDWLRQRDKSARTKDDPHATPYSRAASLIERLLSASPAPPPPSDVVLEQFRANGWMVAVHNDYRLNGERFTFWLLTKGDRCVKGEGRTDAEALAKARQIAALQGSEGGHAGMNAIAPGVVATNAFNLSFALCHGLPFLSMVTHAERVAALEAKLNTPELHDFSRAIVLEAAHQRERWGAAHDHGKAPEDWFWLLGYLGGKALSAAKTGDTAKALHHTISTAAALANWHAALLGASTIMRPGIDPVERGLADAHEG